MWSTWRQKLQITLTDNQFAKWTLIRCFLCKLACRSRIMLSEMFLHISVIEYNVYHFEGKRKDNSISPQKWVSTVSGRYFYGHTIAESKLYKIELIFSCWRMCTTNTGKNELPRFFSVVFIWFTLHSWPRTESINIVHFGIVKVAKIIKLFGCSMSLLYFSFNIFQKIREISTNDLEKYSKAVNGR